MKVFVGWDPSEIKAYLVATNSLHTNATERHDVRRLALDELQAKGLYTRLTTSMVNGQLYDVISEAPMSTGHAISRFFVPMLCDYTGWALFTDGDVLFRDNVKTLMNYADDRFAVCVVQHPPMRDVGEKKGGHIQSLYPRKNWSSVMLFNCGHPANLALNQATLNAWPGRDLHAFKWLSDDQIGVLPFGWNYLVNVTDPMPDTVSLAHYTLGIPDVPGHEHDPFADEWRDMAKYSGFKDTKVPA